MTKVSLRNLLLLAWLRWAAEWRRFARSLTRNDADAEDLVNEAITRTLEVDPDLASERDVHRYVLKAMRRIWINVVTQRRRRRKRLRELQRDIELFAPSVWQKFVELERERLLDQVVNDALEKMGPEIAGAYLLYTDEEPPLVLREVAAILEVSTSTAHTRVQEAFRILADALEEFEE